MPKSARHGGVTARRLWQQARIVVCTSFVMTAVAAIAPSNAGEPTVASDVWVSLNFQDHPLAGTIWTSDFQAVTKDQLEKALSNATFVLLGETHDNPDHHRLQAQLIGGLVAAGRRPAVVFEMIDAEMQAELDRQAQGGPGKAGGLGEALRWEERGWPEWAMYRPIAEAALTAGLPLVAGGLNGSAQRTLSKVEPLPVYTQIVEALGLGQPLRPEIAAAEGIEIKEGHCNLLPDHAVPAMIQVQRAKDATLANAMVATKPGIGAVLIAGAGHARKDWAVPASIYRKLPDASVVSVAFMEVDPAHTSPSDYMPTVSGLEKPFDFIYLTPRANLTDQCAELKKQLDARKAQTLGQP